jgi:Cu/Ag efflux protein CusF
MKRSLILTLALAFSVSAFAATTTATKTTTTTKTHKAVTHGTSIKGTIKSVDETAKSFVLTSGTKDNTIYWTTATKVNGGPLAAGQNIVGRAMEKDSKWWATSVKVMPVKAAAAATKKK